MNAYGGRALAKNYIAKFTDHYKYSLLINDGSGVLCLEFLHVNTNTEYQDFGLIPLYQVLVF